MKKTILIIVVVALLGTLATFAANGNSNANKATLGADITPTSTVSDTAIQTPTAAPTASTATTLKDGTYTGHVSSNRYESIKVTAVIQNGKLVSANMSASNTDEPRSDQINELAAPKLNKQAVAAQSANIDGVSGASDTSESYIQSLQSALDQARA